MKISVQDFFQHLYDNQFFCSNAMRQVTNLPNMNVTCNDDTAIKTNPEMSINDMFKQDMMSLRIEITGLAFCHSIKNDNLKIQQSIFTKDYLGRINQMIIWDNMLIYNKVIAESGYDIVSTERIKRGWDTFLNTFKIELLKKWESKGTDIDCAIRVLNRYGTEVAWQKGICINYLAAKLLERLEIYDKEYQESVLVLSSTFRRFYQDAKDSIKKQKFI